MKNNPRVVDANYIHLILNMLDVLFPGQGYIVHITPPIKGEGMPVMMSNMTTEGLIDMTKDFLKALEEGTSHEMFNSQSLKN